MSFRALMLHVILCVALVFNGAASAMVSARMAQMHGQTGEVHSAKQAPVAAAGADDARPCHDNAHAMHDGARGDAKPAKGEQPAPDCCKSNTCTCACVNHVAAVVPPPAFQASPIAHDNSVRRMTLGHAAPPLPNLIRPPIG